ncbi:MAG: CoB--CoM heterodisulfide reductase iron-sulfur subunit A family protein, partial [Nitrospinota bacterium]
MTSPHALPVVIVGGGISGITTAIEAAETGANVVLIEKEPYIGGRVSRMNRYFPKLCSPLCGMEINYRRLKSNPRIKVITLAQLESVSGEKGNFELKLKKAPRFVNDNCTSCDKCTAVCPVERDDDFNYSMNKTKAIYLPHNMAYPQQYVIDPETCKGSECAECVKACKYGAIDLGEKEETLTIKAVSLVYATGWEPYDARKIDNLGFGRVKNVINNVMMERLASPSGPTGGKIVRPSDGKEVKKIAFVQCAGSRDEDHLPYCSSVCCLASLKQATYVREAYPDSKVTIFYIDIRTPGKYEAFYKKVSDDENVAMVKGKVAKVEEDSGTGDVLVTAEDILGGTKAEARVDMVVLATGMSPSAHAEKLNGDAGKRPLDEDGFIDTEKMPEGVFAAGVAKRPLDVNLSLQDA